MVKAGQVAKSQQDAATGVEEEAKQLRKVRMLTSEQFEFTHNRQPMLSRVRTGETYTVADAPGRPKIRRVDRSLSTSFAEELVSKKKAEWV